MSPPPCLGGASRWSVQVNTHGTPAPSMNGRPWVAQATENATKHHSTRARARQARNMSPDCNSVNMVAEQSDDHRRRGDMQIFVKTLTERASTVSVRAVVIEISVDAERRQTMWRTLTIVMLAWLCEHWRESVSENPTRAIDEWVDSWLIVRVESCDRSVIQFPGPIEARSVAQVWQSPVLRFSWLERLARRSSHKARLTELNTNDDEIGQRPSRSSRGGADYELWNVLDECVVCRKTEFRPDNGEVVETMRVQRDATNGSDHFGHFLLIWSQRDFKSWTQLLPCGREGVHESSTVLSKRRFDRSDCTGRVQMTGSPRLSRSTWRVDGVTFRRRLVTVELKALMNMSWPCARCVVVCVRDVVLVEEGHDVERVTETMRVSTWAVVKLTRKTVESASDIVGYGMVTRCHQHCGGAADSAHRQSSGHPGLRGRWWFVFSWEACVFPKPVTSELSWFHGLNSNCFEVSHHFQEVSRMLDETRAKWPWRK